MPASKSKRTGSKPPISRDQLEELIEAAVALLDEIDGDENLEPDLGSVPWPPGRYALDAEYDPSEDEPSLGSADRMLNQENWSRISGWYPSSDLELDRSDNEPNLGSVTGCSQERWAQGIDAEENGDERDRNGDEGDYSYLSEEASCMHLKLGPTSEDIAASQNAAACLAVIADRVKGATR